MRSRSFGTRDNSVVARLGRLLHPNAPWHRSVCLASASMLLMMFGHRAQAQGSMVSGVAMIRIPPMLAVRDITAPRVIDGADATTLWTNATIAIDANVPYTVRVRSVGPRTSRQRVFVRDVTGRLTPIDEGEPVTVAAAASGGHREHRIECRIEADARTALRPDSCTFVYDVSADTPEHPLRVVATLAPSGSAPRRSSTTSTLANE